MLKPKILVTLASGNTGFQTALQLLEKGYPVRAMVRKSNQRSETLRQMGAEVTVGNMDDIVEMRQALNGVQRAYYCAPISRDALATGVTFAIAAQETKLEMVTAMSQWLADPTSPSIHTRTTWLTDRLLASMPDVATATVNPGWFADNYRLAGLEVIAHLGLMMIPLGEGLNAPPSNEDIARVVVGTLTNPLPHGGKTYRPTGPRLLSPHQIAEIYGRVLGHRVRYIDGPDWLFSKAGQASGYSAYQMAQLFPYFEEYRRNTFAIGAPTDDVLEVGGRAPEDFETIARRYFAAEPNAQRTLGGFTRTMLNTVRVMLTPSVDPEPYARQHDFPRLRNARLAGDSPEWRTIHAQVATAPNLMRT